MKHKRSISHKERLRTSLKVSIGAIAAVGSVAVVILIVIVNFSKQEDSIAGSPMVFVGANTSQDTTFVYRGSTNQQGLGVVIQTNGEGSPLRITSIDFRGTVTSGTISDCIENARLWSTGKDPEFYCSVQVGKTLPVFSAEKISMQMDQFLMPGKNYFWLTFDIKPGAISPSMLDVFCTNIKMGAINYTPLISSPLGSRMVTGNVAYYSQGDGSLNHPDSWNSKRDGSGEKPVELKNERNVFFIQSGHNMQCVAGISLASVCIENGGYLKSTATLKTKRMEVQTGATFEQKSTVTDFNTIQTFVIGNKGTYIHDNTGYLPGRWCQFAANSTQQFLQYGMATFPATVVWGNVILASSSKLNFDMQKNFRHVQGNMEFKQTGPANYLYCDASDTIEINGNLLFTGGNFIGVSGNNHRLLIKVKGDLIMEAGAFTDAEEIGTSQSHTILELGGSVHFTGGTFDFAQASDRSSSLYFVPGETAVSEWIQTGGEVLMGNVSVQSDKQLSLTSPYCGSIAANYSFVVEPGGTLYCNKSQLTGAGRFVLENRASIFIGHAAGINSAGMEGNIITGQRIFSTGARYTYYQEMNPQATGKFVTDPIPGTIRELTIQKDAQSQWLTLSQDMMVIENININKGVVEKNSRRLLKTDLSNFSEAGNKKLFQ